MIKNEFNKIMQIWNNALSSEPYDFFNQRDLYKLLSADLEQTLNFLNSANIDEIELASEIMIELVFFFQSQELLDIFKRFIGQELKYISTESYDEDVYECQYILDNNIEVEVPNKSWV